MASPMASVLVLPALAALAVAGFAWADDAEETGQEQVVPNCIRAWSEARYSGAGYNHLVFVANGCAATITCATWTNVNPDAMSLTVSTGETVEVLTFRGSPASTFTPFLRCRPTEGW